MRLISTNKESLSIEYYPHFKCNQRCSYCYLRNELNDKNIDEKIFNDFLEFLIKCKEKYSNIELSFLGGEPLLTDDLINKLNKIYNIIGSFTILTNGSLLYKFNKDDFKKFYLYVSIHEEYITEKYINNINNFFKDYDGEYLLSIKIKPNSNIDKLIINKFNTKHIEISPIVDNNIYTLNDIKDNFDDYNLDIQDNISIEHNNTIINDKNIVNLFLNKTNYQFKNSICRARLIRINPNGDVVHQCMTYINYGYFNMDFDIPTLCKNNQCEPHCYKIKDIYLLNKEYNKILNSIVNHYS